MARKPVPQTGLIVSSAEAERLRQQGHEISIQFGGESRPWFGWQKRYLSEVPYCLADEVGAFGGKSGGKSEFMRVWLVSGNPHLPDYDEDGTPLPFNQSYTYHPDYYGLILRKNQKDLDFFLRQAQRMWAPFGADYKNGGFIFPAGARIDCGHMDTEDAWHKYIGNEYQRVAIDEAALIPDYGPIEELRSCMRTPHEDILRIQIVYASNAGGPGTHWIISRFMSVRDQNNEVIPHDTLITEKRVHPFTGKEEVRTRIWAFSTIQDNTVMRENRYATDLLYLGDEKRRKAYFYGQWDALFGSYFGDIFRPDGPIHANNEPAHARHVIQQREVNIQPWWHQSIGMDWGHAHEASILWAARSPEGQVIVHDELVTAQASPEALGYEIGRRSRPILEKLPSHSIVMHLSHDAFANRPDAKSIVELIAAGIARVLGSKAVHIPDLVAKRMREAYQEEAYRPDQIEEREEAIRQIKLQRKMGITIRMAEKTSVIGWQHCRELMRWQSIGEYNVKFERELFMKLLADNPAEAEEYARAHRGFKPEVLPKLLIIKEKCPRLIDAIPRAQHEDGTENVDKAHFHGKDSVDSFSYLVTGMRDEKPQEPFEAFRHRQIEEIKRQSPNFTTPDLIRANMVLEAEWAAERIKKQHPYSPPGRTRLARLVRSGKWQQHSQIDKRLNNAYTI